MLLISFWKWLAWYTSQFVLVSVELAENGNLKEDGRQILFVLYGVALVVDRGRKDGFFELAKDRNQKDNNKKEIYSGV